MAPMVSTPPTCTGRRPLRRLIWKRGCVANAFGVVATISAHRALGAVKSVAVLAYQDATSSPAFPTAIAGMTLEAVLSPSGVGAVQPASVERIRYRCVVVWLPSWTDT